MTLDAGDGGSGRQLLPLRRFVVESHPQLDRMIGTSRKLIMKGILQEGTTVPSYLSDEIH